MHNSKPSTFKSFYPCGWCHLKINHPSLHTLKKYVSGPSFNLLHGWLHQVPFSHFGHKTTYPCRWRNPKIHHSSLHTLKNIPLDQVSASYLAPGSVRIHFRVLAGKQPTPMMVPCNKNKPPQSSSIKKYAYGPSFSVLHGSKLCQDPFSCFSH